MKQACRILFFLLLSPGLLFADGAAKIDSLKRELTKTTNEEARFSIYEGLFRNVFEQDTEIGKYYLDQCFSIAEKTNNNTLKLKAKNLQINSWNSLREFKKVIANAPALEKKLAEAGLKKELGELYESLGYSYAGRDEFRMALEVVARCDSFAEANEDVSLQCENALLAGGCYTKMNNSAKAVIALQRALSLAEKTKDTKRKCRAALNLGAVYSEGANRDFSIKYLDMASRLAFALKDTDLIFQSQMYLGNVYYYNKDYQRALSTYEQVRPYCVGPESRSSYAGLLGNIGNVYADMGESEKGFQLQKQSLDVFIELGDKEAQAICYNTIGLYYFEKKDYKKAIQLLDTSLAIAKEIDSKEDMLEAYLNLSAVYQAIGDYKKTFENYKLYKDYSDSVFSSTNTKELTELELNYRFDNKQKEEELKQLLEQERFKRSKYLAVSGILLLLLIIAVVIRNNRQRKNANELLKSSNSQILFQKEQVEIKNKEVEHKNKNITDSINYAKRIQNSILPPDSLVYGLLPDSFVLYKPKDIVSGDFYWVEQKRDEVIFAAVDCTGHGVPGAMMSVLGFNLLTQAVKEGGLTKPSDILNHLDNGVSTMLRQSTESENVKDGMDLALCSLNFTTGQLQFAGAYNGLWIVKKGGHECIEIKPDKMPIGSNVNGIADQYTNHSVVLQKGDTVYIFTDGYADQFGGPKGKKFKYKQLEQVLVANHQLPMIRQKEILDKTFEDWKGSQDQVDDVLIIGVRYA